MSIILQFLLCCLADGRTKESRKKNKGMKALKIAINHFEQLTFMFGCRSIEFISKFFLSLPFFIAMEIIVYHLVRLKNDINKFHQKHSQHYCCPFIPFSNFYLPFFQFMHAVAELNSKILFPYNSNLFH